MLRKLIGTVLWLGSVGATGAIMYNAMGIQATILTAIGVLGLIAASAGIFLAMEAVREGAPVAFLVSLLLWLVGEAFIVPSEINYWAATVTAKAEHEDDVGRQAGNRRMVLERAAIDLAAQKPARAAAIVQADIDAALVRDIGRTTLGAATANCTDLQSAAIWRCKEVLTLRRELAAAQSYERSTSLVWDANTTPVSTVEAHGAHDGPAQLADMIGGTTKQWGQILIVVTVALLFLTRGFGLYIGWRRAPARRVLTIEARDIETLPALETDNRLALAAPAVERVPAIPDVSRETSNVLPMERPAQPAPKTIPSLDPMSIEGVIAAVARSFGPCEKAMPAIATAVKTLAAVRGITEIPHATTIGAVLSDKLGYPRRRGNLKEGRSMIYNFAVTRHDEHWKETCAG